MLRTRYKEWQEQGIPNGATPLHWHKGRDNLGGNRVPAEHAASLGRGAGSQDIPPSPSPSQQAPGLQQPSTQNLSLVQA